MIDFTIIALFIILILGIIAIFSLTHKIIKVVLFVIGYVLIISVVIGGAIFLDAQKFSEKMNEEPILFVLMEDGETKSFIAISDEDGILASVDYQKDVDNENWNFLLKDFYKIFFIDLDIFDEYEFDEVKLGDYSFNEKQTYDVLVSKAPLELLPPEFLDFNNDEIRATFFSTSILMKIMGENPIELIHQIKNGNVWVEKETPMFKVIQYIPEKSIMKLLEKTNEKIGGVVDEFSR
jgi:hypothetical protein